MQTQTPTRKHTTVLGPQRWTVPSATTPGVVYTVTADPQTTELRCDCPNGQAGKCQCWHLKAVRTGLAGRPRVRVSQRPARREITAATRDLATALEV